MLQLNYNNLFLNIFFYIFYVLCVSIVFSFLFPLVLYIFNFNILSPNNPIFDYIQIWILMIVLLLTILKRKYFYYEIVKQIEKQIKNTKDIVKQVKTFDLKIGKDII